jgi:hypothetical protein
MTNEQMKAGRFYRWHNYRKMIANIQATLAADGIIQIVGYGRVIQADKRHVSMFKADRTGAYIQRGKSWDCLNFSKIIHCRRMVA